MTDELFLIMLLFGRVYFQISLLDYLFQPELNSTQFWYLLVVLSNLIPEPWHFPPFPLLWLFQFAIVTLFLFALVFHWHFCLYLLFFHFSIYSILFEFLLFFPFRPRNHCFYH